MSGQNTERRFAEADRSIKTGQVAAGCAHEVNNLLGPLIWNLEKLGREREVLDNRTLQRNVRDALDVALRIRVITRDLLSFARCAAPPHSDVDINRVVADACRLAQPRMQRRARLIVESRAVPTVMADEAALVHAVLNLLLNAAEAFDEPDVDTNEVRVHVRTQEQELCVEVRDNGRGIAPQLQSRIFEPFFTTRATGEGTGLGLSVCRDIARAHGGRVKFESQAKLGTTFQFCLPLGSQAEQDAE